MALATGSKPGISTDLVPLELKLDAGGDGESVCVRVRSRAGECAPLVVDPDAKPAAFSLGSWEISVRVFVRVNSKFLQFTYWCFVGIGAELDGSDFSFLR